jgi:hypothetical protein
MNNLFRYCFSTGIAGLVLASICQAGVETSPADAKQVQVNSSISGLKSMRVLSEPVGARILINGDYVGITPLRVDIAVDRFGRAVRDLEMRAVAPEPMANQEIRRFPAAGTDGDASRIPHLVAFDLNVQSVVVIR